MRLCTKSRTLLKHTPVVTENLLDMHTLRVLAACQWVCGGVLVALVCALVLTRSGRNRATVGTSGPRTGPARTTLPAAAHLRTTLGHNAMWRGLHWPHWPNHLQPLGRAMQAGATQHGVVSLDHMGVIYCILPLHPHMPRLFYVGKTGGSALVRFRQHVRKALRNRHPMHGSLSAAIKVHGWKNFAVLILQPVLVDSSQVDLIW